MVPDFLMLAVELGHISPYPTNVWWDMFKESANIGVPVEFVQASCVAYFAHGVFIHPLTLWQASKNFTAVALALTAFQRPPLHTRSMRRGN